MRIPGKCDHCQIVFWSVFDVPYRETLRVENCHQNCPKCFRFADILTGTFEHIENGIRLIDGPDDSKRAIELLQRAIDDIRSMQFPKDQVLANLRSKSPEAAKALQGWLGLGIAFAGLVLAAVTAYADWKDRQSNESKEQVIERAYSEFLENHADEQGRIDLTRPPAKPLFHKPADVVAKQENRQVRRAKRAEDRRNRP